MTVGRSITAWMNTTVDHGQKGNARFPDMKGLADKLEKKGCPPGYLGPSAS